MGSLGLGLDLRGNNVLTVLNVMLKTAVEWDVIERVPCAIKPVAEERARRQRHPRGPRARRGNRQGIARPALAGFLRCGGCRDAACNLTKTRRAT